jgi:subfamily B ATP-binding cassette protein MsbA
MQNRPAQRFSRLSELLRPHTRALLLGLVAVIGESVGGLLEPWPLKIVLDDVFKSGTEHGWLNRFVLAVAGADKLAVLRFAALSVLFIAIFEAICTYTEKSVTTTVGQWVTHDLRRTLYSHIQRQSLAYHDHSRTGDLISRVTSDIDSIQSFLVSGLLDALVNIITLGGMIGVMFYVNWRFTLIALSVAPVLAAVVFTYTRRIKKAAREVRKKQGEIVSVMEEVLSSIRVVKAFAREGYEQRRLEEESLEGVEIALRARSLKAKLAPLVEVIVAVGTALVLWFGARMVLSGSLAMSSMIVFIWYLGKMYKPMQELSKMTDSMSKASVGYERIVEVLDTERDVKDLPGARTAPRLRGAIEFRDVEFSYDHEVPVLRNFNMKIEAGQTVALVGPTGAGKSTVISLIPRFYDPTAGVITIDGQDIRSFTQKSLRRQISFVLQETELFHGTIWHNIAYGKPDATRNEILLAAEHANASEFIDKMPEGYDTIVGERGMTLSGGQRQRIAIARAIIRNTPILILDEPSSGLDAASEKLVFDAMERLMKGKTSIVIAHRLSTIRNADLIVVVKDGTVAESGTHDDLMRRGGVYAELHDLQFGAEEHAPNREEHASI